MKYEKRRGVNIPSSLSFSAGSILNSNQLKNQERQSPFDLSLSLVFPFHTFRGEAAMLLRSDCERRLKLLAFENQSLTSKGVAPIFNLVERSKRALIG